MSEPRIEITWDKKARMYVVGDEDGEFARSDYPEGLMRYVLDLIYGPGTQKAGPIQNRRPITNRRTSP